MARGASSFKRSSWLRLRAQARGLLQGLFEGFAAEDGRVVVVDAVDGADRHAGVAVDALLGIDGVHEVVGIEVVNRLGGGTRGGSSHS